MGYDASPIDVLYWSDYLCPYCQVFALDIHPKLITNEVKPKNARFVFLELPYRGENSRPASMLAKAVWRTVADDDPNQYWEWHQAVFEHQEKPDSGWADRDNLLAITSDVGIDTDTVTAYLDTHRRALEQEIEREIDAADRAKIPGTPAFYLSNRNTGQTKTVIGAQPYSRYRAAIHSLLE